MEAKVVPGQLVESRSGRDSGRLYLVMNDIGEKYVLVADGVVRRLENPKKKNIKHLKSHSLVAKDIASKLKTDQRINNNEIRRAIQCLIANPEELPF